MRCLSVKGKCGYRLGDYRVTVAEHSVPLHASLRCQKKTPDFSFKVNFAKRQNGVVDPHLKSSRSQMICFFFSEITVWMLLQIYHFPSKLWLYYDNTVIYVTNEPSAFK